MPVGAQPDQTAVARLLLGREPLGLLITADELADALWLAPLITPVQLEEQPAGPSGTLPPREQPQQATDSGTDRPPTAEQSSAAQSGPPEPESEYTDSSLETRLDQSGPQDGEPSPEAPSVGLHRLNRQPPQDGAQTASGVSHPASPLASAEVYPLPGALDLARALRPLKIRVPVTGKFELDESRTASALAEARLAERHPSHDLVHTVVTRPRTERWLDVALVVDAGETMAIWQPTVTRLRLLLEHHGAFRDVKTWWFDGSGFTRTRPAGGVRAPAAAPPRGGERRLVLLLTDGLSPWWRDGTLGRVLRGWAQTGPAAVIQALPFHLWDRTWQSIHQVRMRAHRPGSARLLLRPSGPWTNQRWMSQDQNGQQGANGPDWVPVLELAAPWFEPWARALGGRDADWFPGMAVDLNAPVADFRNERRTEEAPDPRKLVRDFRFWASHEAFALASFLAAAPLTLPAMRFVQSATLRDSQPAHLAEVYLSGLLERKDDDPDPDSVLYEFRPGVREELLSRLSRSQAYDVLDQLTRAPESVTRPLGVIDLHALVLDPEGTMQIPAESRAFAHVAATVFDGLGGRFAQIADRLNQELAPTPPEPEPEEAGDVRRLTELETAINARLRAEQGTDVPAITVSFEMPTRQDARFVLSVGSRSIVTPVPGTAIEIMLSSERPISVIGYISAVFANADNTDYSSSWMPHGISNALPDVNEIFRQTSSYVRLPASQSLWNAINTPNGAAWIEGHSGSGRTTAAYGLAARWLRDDPERNGLVVLDLIDPRCGDESIALAMLTMPRRSRYLAVLDNAHASPATARRALALLDRLRDSLGMQISVLATSSRLGGDFQALGLTQPVAVVSTDPEFVLGQLLAELPMSASDGIRTLVGGDLVLAKHAIDYYRRRPIVPTRDQLVTSIAGDLGLDLIEDGSRRRELYKRACLAMFEIDGHLAQERSGESPDDFLRRPSRSLASVVVRYARDKWSPSDGAGALYPEPTAVAANFLAFASAQQIKAVLDRRFPLQAAGHADASRSQFLSLALLQRKRVVERLRSQVERDPRWGGNAACAALSGIALGKLGDQRWWLRCAEVVWRAWASEADHWGRDWMLGILLSFHGTAPTKNQDRLLGVYEVTRLVQTRIGAFEPEEEPWVTAQVLIGLCDAGYGETEVAVRAEEWLRAYGAPFRRPGAGQSTSELMNTALRLIALRRCSLSNDDTVFELGYAALLSHLTAAAPQLASIDQALAAQALLLTDDAASHAEAYGMVLDQLAWVLGQHWQLPETRGPADESLDGVTIPYVICVLLDCVSLVAAAELQPLVADLDRLWAETVPSRNETQVPASMTSSQSDASARTSVWRTVSRTTSDGPVRSFEYRVPVDDVRAMVVADHGDEPPRLVLCGRSDVSVHDLATGRPVKREPLTASAGRPMALATSRRQTLVAVAGPAGIDILRVLPKYGALGRVPVRYAADVAFAWMDSGPVLAAADDRAVSIWDVTQMSPLAEISTGPVKHIALSPWFAYSLLAVANGTSVKVWDFESQRQIDSFTTPSEVRELAFGLHDARHFLAVGQASGSILLRLPNHPDRLRRDGQQWRDHAGPIRTLAFLPWSDGLQLVSGGDDGTVRLSESDGHRTHLLSQMSTAVAAVASARLELGTRPVVIAADAGGTVTIWDRISPSATQTGSRRELVPTVIALSESAAPGRFAVGADDGSLRLFSLADGRAARRGLMAGSHRVCAIAFGPFTLVASGHSDGTVRVWDSSTGDELWRAKAHRGWVRALEFVVDGSMLVSGGADGTVRSWEATTGEFWGTLFASNEEVRGLSSVRGDDGGLLAIGSGRSARVFRLSDRTVVYESPRTQSAIRSIALGRFSLSGPSDRPGRIVRSGRTGVVAVGEASGKITVAELGVASPAHALSEHSDAVRALALGGLDGRPVLASAADDNQVLIWDLQDGALLDDWRAQDGEWVGAAQFAFRAGRLYRGLVIDESVEIAYTELSQTAGRGGEANRVD